MDWHLIVNIKINIYGIPTYKKNKMIYINNKNIKQNGLYYIYK